MASTLDELDKDFAERMKRLKELDIEERHLKADELLCQLLKSLGCRATVKEFEKLGKWYA